MNRARMQSFDAIAPAVLRGLSGVLTDIDDTLTTAGAITPEALAALHALRAAGVPVIAITGRPAGWSAPFAQAWPVTAIVAENGAVAMFREHGDTKDSNVELRTEFAQAAETRAANALRLRHAAARVLGKVPGATLARDSAGRLTDIAIDHSEFASLSAAQIERVLALMRAEGMQATVSSIHINGWFGAHDKVSGARWMLRRLFGLDLNLDAAAERERWLYVGDSTNDQAMFAAFPHSVGVANLLRFADRLTVWPAWLTRAERGAGFAEVAQRVLAARNSKKDLFREKKA